MIIHKGDITTVTQGIVVHGCNAQGRMGSGVAKAVRATWVEAFEAYMEVHYADGLKVGQTIFAEYPDGLVIVNAITQEYYGYDGRLYLDYEALDKCFREINEFCIDHEIKQVHFPKIGAGLAGGDWNKIEKIIKGCISDTIELHLWVL